MKPLGGIRVVVTRPRHQADDLAGPLEALGAQALLLPTIEIVPPSDLGSLQSVLGRLEEFDWVVFTSTNGVDSVASVATATRVPMSGWGDLAVAGIGPATRSALHAQGVQGVFVPPEFRSESLGEAIPVESGQRVLLLRAEQASPVLPERLRGRGALIEDVVAYRTVVAAADDRTLEVVRRGVDAITFTSPSTVEGFLSLLAGEAHAVTRGAVVACIGPVTGAAARAAGFAVAVEADEYTVQGLVRSLVGYYEPRDGNRTRSVDP